MFYFKEWNFHWTIYFKLLRIIDEVIKTNDK